MSLIEKAIQKNVDQNSLTTSPRSDVVKRRRKNVRLATGSERLQNMAENELLTEDELLRRNIATDLKTGNAFRALRTELFKENGGRNFVLAVTSCKKGGGSSFVATNLAASIAADNTKSAVIVDCNFLNPNISSLLKIDVSADLIDFFNNKADIEDIIYKVGINRLRVIPTKSSPNHSDEFITSPKMEDFIEELKFRYPDRYIILDVPSMHESADAGILHEISDYSVVVVNHGEVDEDELSDVVEGMDEEKFLGVIYNKSPFLN